MKSRRFSRRINNISVIKSVPISFTYNDIKQIKKHITGTSRFDSFTVSENMLAISRDIERFTKVSDKQGGRFNLVISRQVIGKVAA